MSGMVLLVQLALGLLFALSFLAKLRAPRAFLDGVERYGILPPKAAHAAGAALIATEGFLACAHLSGWLLVPASLLGLATLAVFLAAVGVNLKRRRKVPCFCFDSAGGEEISARTLVRLLLMAAGELLVIAGIRTPGTSLHRFILPGRVASTVDLLHAVLFAALLLVGAAWLLRAPDLWALFHRGRCYLCSPLAQREVADES